MASALRPVCKIIRCGASPQWVVLRNMQSLESSSIARLTTNNLAGFNICLSWLCCSVAMNFRRKLNFSSRFCFGYHGQWKHSTIVFPNIWIWFWENRLRVSTVDRHCSSSKHQRFDTFQNSSASFRSLYQGFRTCIVFTSTRATSSTISMSSVSN